MFSQAKKHLCQTFRKESVLPPRENRSRAALDSSKKMRQVIKGTALATIRINKIKTTEFDTRPKENEGGNVKVLLVYPEFPDTYWSFKHALSFDHKLSAFPSLGVITIAAMLWRPRDWFFSSSLNCFKIWTDHPLYPADTGEL